MKARQVALCTWCQRTKPLPWWLDVAGAKRVADEWLRSHDCTPSCNDECGGSMRRFLADLGVEATVSHQPPIVPTPYSQPGMTCPHGVTWHGEPTTDQIAAWARDGVA